MSVTQKLLEKIVGAIERAEESVRNDVRAGLAETNRAVRLTGARYLPLPASAQLMWGGQGRLVGWSAQATGGPVRLVLRDGRDTSADVVAVVDLADGEHDRTWFGPGGVSFGEALYCERTGTGGITGALYLGAVD